MRPAKQRGIEENPERQRNGADHPEPELRRVWSRLGSGGRADDHGVDAVQVFRRVIVNFDAALLLGLFDDADLGAEDALQLLNGGLNVRIGFELIKVLGLASFEHALGGALGLADAPSLRDGFLRHFPLEFDFGKGTETAGMASGEAALSNQLLDIGRKLEEPEEVDDGGAIFTGALSNLIGVEEEFAAQAVKGNGGFDGVQILALDVLDQGDFEQTVVGDFADNNRHRLIASQFGGTPTALTGDQLIACTRPADHQRLDNAVGADGLRQFGQALTLKHAPRL